MINEHIGASRSSPYVKSGQRKRPDRSKQKERRRKKGNLNAGTSGIQKKKQSGKVYYENARDHTKRCCNISQNSTKFLIQNNAYARGKVRPQVKKCEVFAY